MIGKLQRMAEKKRAGNALANYFEGRIHGKGPREVYQSRPKAESGRAAEWGCR